MKLLDSIMHNNIRWWCMRIDGYEGKRTYHLLRHGIGLHNHRPSDWLKLEEKDFMGDASTRKDEGVSTHATLDSHEVHSYTSPSIRVAVCNAGVA